MAHRHNGGMAEPQSNAARVREINDSIRYTMWSVFRLEAVLGEDSDRVAEGAEVEKLFAELAEADVVVRGVYDVSGLRADADVMVWWHAAASEELQAAYHRFRRTRSDAGSRRSGPSSRCTGRPSSTAATSRRSSPTRRRRRTSASTRSCAPTSGTSSRRPSAAALLAEHGQMARDYKDVRANTVASFALGDYEWILAFEADELHRIVDLMRALRALGCAPARARGDPVLHGLAGHRRGPRRPAALSRSGQPRSAQALQVHSASGSSPSAGARSASGPISVRILNLASR